MKVRSQDKPQTDIPEEKIKLLAFTKAEGWFVMEEYELPKSVIEKYGKLVSKTQPDIFAIFKEQVISKIRDFYGI